MKTRKQLISRLHQLRRQGWEKHILQYGIPFNEKKATYQELATHVLRIERYRSNYRSELISITIKFLAILAVLLIIILSHI